MHGLFDAVAGWPDPKIGDISPSSKTPCKWRPDNDSSAVEQCPIAAPTAQVMHHITSCPRWDPESRYLAEEVPAFRIGI
jgi:hypothetical protein